VQEFYARAADTVSDWPLAVLINRSSASSAEIVAGALQDHGRAVIVGERSFGKGSVQHLIHLTSQKAAVKLTVAYYRLPGGRLIHKTAENASLDTWGVKPDEAVSLTPQERKQVQEARRALDTRFGPQAAGAEAGTAGTDAEPDAAIPLDPQLAAALRRVRSAVLAQPSDTKSSASPG
jgi:carboxyl-terminal processing protease